MPRPRVVLVVVSAGAALALAFATAGTAPGSAGSPAPALEECRLLRQPDIHGDRIVFVYAGDLWTVSRAGGTSMASPGSRNPRCMSTTTSAVRPGSGDSSRSKASRRSGI